MKAARKGQPKGQRERDEPLKGRMLALIFERPADVLGDHVDVVLQRQRHDMRAETVDHRALDLLELLVERRAAELKQEALRNQLHVDVAFWGGVVVPGLLVTALILLPYLDRKRAGVGVWFARERWLANGLFALLVIAIVAQGAA